jgi:hypothetical protein
MTKSDLALLFFNAVNCVRLLAYVPQIVTIVRGCHGAEGVSCLSWALFGLAHLATAVYAWVTAGDAWMAFVFVVNFAACGLIIALTVYKRRAATRLAAQQISGTFR